jgi:hypothetical protein
LIARSGRALVMPVYQGTFQRFAGVGEFPREDQMNAYRDMVVHWSKDLGRSIDYRYRRGEGRVLRPQCGRHDSIFPLDDVAKPLFTLLGAPADRKRHAIHEGGHLPPLNELIRDVLGWFDQYLGPVATR